MNSTVVAVVVVGVTTVFSEVNLFSKITTKADPAMSRLSPVIVLGWLGFPEEELKLVRAMASF